MPDDVCAVRRSRLCTQRNREIARMFCGECQVPIAQGSRAPAETAAAGANRRNREGNAEFARVRGRRSWGPAVSAGFGALPVAVIPLLGNHFEGSQDSSKPFGSFHYGACALASRTGPLKFAAEMHEKLGVFLILDC